MAGRTLKHSVVHREKEPKKPRFILEDQTIIIVGGQYQEEAVLTSPHEKLEYLISYIYGSIPKVKDAKFEGNKHYEWLEEVVTKTTGYEIELRRETRTEGVNEYYEDMGVRPKNKEIEQMFELEEKEYKKAVKEFIFDENYIVEIK